MSNQAVVIILLLVTFGPVGIYCLTMTIKQKKEDRQIEKADKRRMALKKEDFGH